MNDGTYRRLRIRFEIDYEISTDLEATPRTGDDDGERPIAATTSPSVAPDIEMYEYNAQFPAGE
jgi:hypothetical protein